MRASLLRLAGSMAMAAALPAAIASPTADEYLPCHRQAARALEMCLDAAPGGFHDDCWKRGRAYQQACYRTVKAAHVPDRKRIDAMRRAEDDARKRAAEARSRAQEAQQ
ncbi:hypothetical protein MW7_014675 [Imbroritus primus]|uniref:Uncharacterized protein n=1 Tax=Imbroritus primus TaxID=3058603 RepID=A0ACD3SM08_9BURK|nr:hypothetical protein MW7_014675 [Burkholderiaceae bacterium PBA]